jgi:hypothetical protein
MATTKKVTPVTRVAVKSKPSSKEPVLVIGGDYGYGDYDNYNSDYDEDGSVSSGIVIDKREVGSFNFEIQRMPHSCSILDIGDFGFVKPNTTSSVKEEMVEDLVNLTLNKLLEEITEVSGKKGLCRTVMFTLIETQRELRRIVNKNPNFTLVKSFVNSNSKNTNYLYVSNN